MNIASKLMGVGVANALAYEFQKQITSRSFDRYNLMALGFPHGAATYYEDASKVANVQAKELVYRGVNPVAAKYLEDLSSKVPVVVRNPSIVSGQAKVGSVVVTDGGEFLGPGTITTTYQWYKDDVAILGATDDEYTVVSDNIGEMISVGCIYCSEFGCTSEYKSDAIGPVVS